MAKDPIFVPILIWCDCYISLVKLHSVTPLRSLTPQGLIAHSVDRPIVVATTPRLPNNPARTISYNP